MDLQPLSRENPLTVFILDVPEDIILIISFAENTVVLTDRNLLLQHILFPGGINETLAPQLVNDVFLPGPGVTRMFFRRISRWCLHKACEERRLGPADLPDMLAEIDIRRRLHAVHTMTHVEIVEVEVEYLLLSQVSLQPVCQNSLPEFPEHAPFRSQDKRFDYLLGDGTASLNNTA